MCVVLADYAFRGYSNRIRVIMKTSSGDLEMEDSEDYKPRSPIESCE